jgi:hypothetical protein
MNEKDMNMDEDFEREFCESLTNVIAHELGSAIEEVSFTQDAAVAMSALISMAITVNAEQQQRLVDTIVKDPDVRFATRTLQAMQGPYGCPQLTESQKVQLRERVLGQNEVEWEFLQ